MAGTKTCLKCTKTMDADAKFYQKRNGEKTDLCKNCLTMHIDNFNPDTFLWILKDMDFPYVPEEWNVIRDKAFAAAEMKGKALNGMSVFGKYLSKMRIKQFKDYGWADSEKLQAENEDKRKQAIAAREQHEAILKGQFESGEITESQYKTLMDTSKLNAEAALAPITTPAGVENPYENEDAFADDSVIKNLAADLTEEDKTYLLMKWGKYYQPWEWIQLEKKYNEMMQSFDIQDADTMNTLIHICKTDLKMNRAIDMEDIESYQKLSKVSNDLRKSAKFTAAQNKEQGNDFIDSVGELVAYCEKNGGAIPKYEINTPQDVIDVVIQDLKNYTKDLIYEDKSLAKQIEDYLKKIEIAKQMKEDQKEAKKAGLDTVEINDEDYIDYEDSLQEQREADAEMLNESLGDE